ncbi:DUF1883 domain-containing protein [Ensifer soli]|uniref:DUF1883 domain-containing protein n=1 Tax=Ciceribacter sp. sgz301302 TaxID=3342379 RepID=UPI0035BA16E4
MTKQAIPYTHYDLREQRAGVAVEITLSAVANVRLMTDENFSAYKEAQKHHFIGGIARKSPVRLGVPHSGRWHLVVDMEGHQGVAQSSVRIIEPVTAPRFQPTSGAA